MLKRLAVILLAFLLTSCIGINLPPAYSTQHPKPTEPPKIVSPTWTYNPTFTPSPGTASATFTPTCTETPTPTFTLATSTPLPVLGVDIVGCSTSLDVLHGMGEVTNAYPLIRNETGVTLTNVCATLSASDEDRVHPDKTACIDLLPPGDQVELKLTVDTGFRQDTSIQVDITSAEGFKAAVSRPSCKNIGLPGFALLKVGIVEPIP